MAAKNSGLFLCAVCGMCGTRDHMTDGITNSCKRCRRVFVLEERVRDLEEERRGESGRKDTKAVHKYVRGSSLDRRGRSSEQPKEKKPDEENIGKGDLGKMIEQAIEFRQHFFLGIYPVNKENGMAVDSLYECDGRTLDQRGVWSKRNHPIDKKVKTERHIECLKTYYTDQLKVKNAMETYKLLKSRYFGESLRIKDDEKDSTVDTEKAIVYLRIYSRQQL